VPPVFRPRIVSFVRAMTISRFKQLRIITNSFVNLFTSQFKERTQPAIPYVKMSLDLGLAIDFVDCIFFHHNYFGVDSTTGRVDCLRCVESTYKDDYWEYISLEYDTFMNLRFDGVAGAFNNGAWSQRPGVLINGTFSASLIQ